MLWSNPQTVDLLAFRTSRLETESTKLLKLPFGGFKIIMKNELREFFGSKSLLLTNIVVLSEVLVLGRNATGERVTS